MPTIMDGSWIQHCSVAIRKTLQMHRIKQIKWMNKQACINEAYTPTLIEHIANVITHGIWIFPALLGAFELIRRSSDWHQLSSAIIYGSSLLLVFTVSTIFHSVHYCCNKGQLKDALHRCDRAMIYVFIAASYFPWLNAANFPPDTTYSTMRILVWVMAATGILYQQIFHERYKWLETLFYVIMGAGPSIAVLAINEFNSIKELKIGGVIYLIGLVFFKSDGRIPCAHAIWHLFVAAAAAFHYHAILHNLYPDFTELHPVDRPYGLFPAGHGLTESHSEF